MSSFFAYTAGTLLFVIAVIANASVGGNLPIIFAIWGAAMVIVSRDN